MPSVAIRRDLNSAGVSDSLRTIKRTLTHVGLRGRIPEGLTSIYGCAKKDYRRHKNTVIG